jgi:hypothetical protein
MAFDDFTESFNSDARNSFNNTTNTSANLNVGLTDVGNTDNSVNDSGNLDVAVDGSFNEDSHDVYTDDSDYTWTDGSTNDSGNTTTVSFSDDDSFEVGTRSYSTGFGDLSLGGLGGGAGDTLIDGRGTVLDQSVNQNIDAFSVEQSHDSWAVVGSGDGAIAAGGDVTLNQSLDESTTILGGGDVNVGNVTDITNTIGSGNTYTDSSETTDASQDWDVDDSFNDNSESYTATNSFTDEITSSSDTDWDIDANVIWDSADATIVPTVEDAELPPV